MYILSLSEQNERRQKQLFVKKMFFASFAKFFLEAFIHSIRVCTPISHDIKTIITDLTVTTAKGWDILNSVRSGIELEAGQMSECKHLSGFDRIVRDN